MKTKNKMITNKEMIYHIIFPIIVGGIIYIIFRPTTLLMFSWFDLFKLTDIIFFLRSKFHGVSIYLFSWIIYSLPNGLWSYSLTYIMLAIWKNSEKKYKFIWYITSLILGIGGEFLQYFKVINGVFEMNDIFFYIIGFLFAFIFISYKRELILNVKF